MELDNKNTIDMSLTSKNQGGISSTNLKLLAMLFMLIDHIGAVILDKYMLVITDYNRFNTVRYINEACRAIGRIAFPIFCYQLVVGMKKTHSRLAYLCRLYLFMIITEVIFDLAMYNKYWSTNSQNTYSTLAIGGLAIVCLQSIPDSKYAVFQKIVVSFFFCSIAYILKTDYGFAGVALIVLIYIFYDNKYLMLTVSPTIFLIIYFLVNIYRGRGFNKSLDKLSTEAFSIIAMLLISKDNGIRVGGKALKYFGYLFYPGHLLILYLIRVYLLKI